MPNGKKPSSAQGLWSSQGKIKQFNLIWHCQYYYSLAAIVKLLLCMNRAKWKLAGCIPISQHAWIWFQSNLHSEFSVFLKFVYWIVMVSLLLLYFQAAAQLILICLPHLPHALSRGSLSLTANACHYVCWWNNQTCIPLPILPTMLGKFPTRSCPSDTSLVFSSTTFVIDYTEECTAYQDERSPLLQFSSTPTSPQPQLISSFINGLPFPGTQAFWFAPEKVAVVHSLLRALMLQWYHYYYYYYKIVLKLLLSMNISSLWVFLVYEYFYSMSTALSQVVYKASKSY